jgi:hypothetical protein
MTFTCECRYETSGSIKCRSFTDHLIKATNFSSGTVFHTMYQLKVHSESPIDLPPKVSWRKKENKKKKVKYYEKYIFGK